MPQFRWRGVTIEGDWRFGRASAVSIAQLEMRMLARGIAVTKIAPVKRLQLFQPAVSLLEQAQSLETIALLLESGMRLQEASLVAAEATTDSTLQELWIECAALIEQGKGLEESRMMPQVFNPLIVHLLLISYQAGTLVATARHAAHYARACYDIRHTLRNALLMPVITLGFVVVLLWLIFAFLVPSLTALFSQFNASLPLSTRILLQLSGYARNTWFLGGVVIIGIIIYLGMRSLFRTTHALLLHMPFIGPLYLQWQRIIFAQSLQLLLQGNVALDEALSVIATTSRSPLLRAYATRVAHAVVGGMPLSAAVATIPLPIATPLMIALITAGQESNNLACTLASFAEREMAQFLSKLRMATLVIQPALIIVLGFVVLAVIGAVYMPLLTLVHVVQ